LPGATPDEMITGVVLPLEDAISSVSGIDEISVYASEGKADITCTFVLEREIEGAAQDVREKVAAAINRLPRETLPPVITKEDPQSDPIMTILVSGPMSLRELTEIADKQVRRAIQRVDGVGSVELHGGQARQIRVLLDAQKLASHNFTVLDVREALQRENIEAPGGRMINGPQELGLRTLGRVSSADQFGEVMLGTRGGVPIRMRDVAQVEDGAAELRTWSALFRLTELPIAGRCRTAGGARHLRLHQGVGALVDRAPGSRQHSGQRGGLDLHSQLASRADCGSGDPRLDYFHLHLDEGDGFFA
jgi:HAE1 family hydrophobic/amphiphilic exporter-1